MRPFLVGEPSIFRRQWVTPKGVRKACYVVRWRIGLKGSSGRTQTRDKGGFRTKEAARRYFFDHVLPALDDGHASPNEQHAAQVEEAARIQSARRSVGEFFTPLLESKPVHLSEKSFRNSQSVYRTALEVFGGDTCLDSLTPEDVERLLNHPTPQKRSPSADTIRRRYFILRESLAKAVVRGYMGSNPCDGIKIPRPGKGRLRYLDAAECKLLLQACLAIQRRGADEPSGTWLHALVTTALYTGARQDELLHLEWADIAFDLNQVTIQNKPALRWRTKNGKSRALGVNPVLLSVLRQHRDALQADLDRARAELADLTAWSHLDPAARKVGNKPAPVARYERPPGIQKLLQNAESIVRSLELQVGSSLVFSNPWGEVREEVPRAYLEVLATTGLKKSGATFHTLRHTYASHLAQAGVDLPTLKELMGHFSIITTMRYAHLCPNHTSQKGALMPDFQGDSCGV